MQYTFRVGIPKAYFPKTINQPKFTETYEVVEIQAISRTEAAKLAWLQHGSRWLENMKPSATRIRKISLYVDNPETRTVMGRLNPITVVTITQGEKT